MQIYLSIDFLLKRLDYRIHKLLRRRGALSMQSNFIWQKYTVHKPVCVFIYIDIHICVCINRFQLFVAALFRVNGSLMVPSTPSTFVRGERRWKLCRQRQWLQWWTREEYLMKWRRRWVTKGRWNAKIIKLFPFLFFPIDFQSAAADATQFFRDQSIR